MKTFVKRGNTVEAVQYFGMKAPTWPAFCAFCIEHGLALKIEKDYHEDYSSDPELKARIKYTDLVVGEWVVVDDSYNGFTILNASEFAETYIATTERVYESNEERLAELAGVSA